MITVQKMTYDDFRYMEIPDGDTSIYELINGNIVRGASPILFIKLYKLLESIEIEGKIKSKIFETIDVDVKEVFS